MSIPEPLVLPEVPTRLTEAVAEAFAVHERCAEQRFARRAARALLDARPVSDDPDEKVACRWLEAAARIVLAQAGIPAVETPDRSENSDGR